MITWLAVTCLVSLVILTLGYTFVNGILQSIFEPLYYPKGKPDNEGAVDPIEADYQLRDPGNLHDRATKEKTYPPGGLTDQTRLNEWVESENKSDESPL